MVIWGGRYDSGGREVHQSANVVAVAMKALQSLTQPFVSFGNAKYESLQSGRYGELVVRPNVERVAYYTDFLKTGKSIGGYEPNHPMPDL